MYINTENLLKLENPTTLSLLLLLQSANKKDISIHIPSLVDKDSLERLLQNKFVKYIKGTKNQTDMQKLRLDKKGVDFLKTLSDVEVDEDDIKLEEWLHNTYLKRANYQKSNRTQTKRLLSWFKNETGIEKNELSNLFQCFLNDTFVTDVNDKNVFWEKFNEEKENNPRLQLSNKLENLLWKSSSIYSRKFKLEESLLYTYYVDNKQFVDARYQKFLNKHSKN